MTQTLSIVCDSSVDLPAAEISRLGIEIAPLQVAFSTEFFRDDNLKRPEFYARLKGEPRLPIIAAAMPADFLSAYRKAHERGASVLCLINPFESCSTYTAAYSAAVVAKRDNQIIVDVLNTGRALTGLGAVCVEAAGMAAKGATLAEVVAAIEEATPKIDTYYAPPTTEYFERDGRISIYEMQVGSLKGMLPLIRVWGRVAVVDKAKTQAENIAKMLSRAEAELDGSDATVIVTHADNPGGANDLAAMVKKRLRCTNLIITELGPSAGAYCGAGTVGLGYCPSLVKLN
ncbi:MAG: DegV family protein [Candidatus Binatus sp.]|uniref:DegV family protein n=1 Tax=Candidatus Binatus sp. TaxID=2811406 RepID=UPI00271D14ED|nr:DegV family protein [Candidatus Binatus sp.]MDO8433481.1 DegV family protein [Candidatus Binatus sp.]